MGSGPSEQVTDRTTVQGSTQFYGTRELLHSKVHKSNLFRMYLKENCQEFAGRRHIAFSLATPPSPWSLTEGMFGTPMPPGWHDQRPGRNCCMRWLGAGSGGSDQTELESQGPNCLPVLSPVATGVSLAFQTPPLLEPRSISSYPGSIFRCCHCPSLSWLSTDFFLECSPVFHILPVIFLL